MNLPQTNLLNYFILIVERLKKMTEIALEKFFRLEVEDSSDFGKEVALKELRETPKNVLTGLKRLKYLLES